MDRELARRKPANIVVAGHLPRTEILQAGPYQKAELMRQIHRMARRGEIGSTSTLKQTSYGWQVSIVRIKEPPRVPSWVWKVMAGVILVVALIAALAWALRVIFLAIASALPLALGVGALLLLASLLSGGTVTVNQIVKIRR